MACESRSASSAEPIWGSSSRTLKSRARNDSPCGVVELSDHRPVFIGHEPRDRLFALADQAQGHRLNAARRKTIEECFPDEGRHLVAHQAIHYPTGLLRDDEVLVDAMRVLHRFGDAPFGDLMEEHAIDRGFQILNLARDVPGNRLSLAVGVGSQVDVTGGGGKRPEALDDIVFPLDRLVFGDEAPLDVNPDLTLGKVLDVPDGGFDHVVVAEILVDRLGLGGGLHNDQRPAIRAGRLNKLLLGAFPAGGGGGAGLLCWRLLRCFCHSTPTLNE